MNHKPLGLVVGMVAAAFLAGAGAWAKEKDTGGIAWVKDYAAAAKQAKDEGKWLFVDFYTDT